MFVRLSAFSTNKQPFALRRDLPITKQLLACFVLGQGNDGDTVYDYVDPTRTGVVTPSAGVPTLPKCSADGRWFSGTTDGAQINIAKAFTPTVMPFAHATGFIPYNYWADGTYRYLWDACWQDNPVRYRGTDLCLYQNGSDPYLATGWYDGTGAASSDRRTCATYGVKYYTYNLFTYNGWSYVDPLYHETWLNGTRVPNTPSGSGRPDIYPYNGPGYIGASTRYASVPHWYGEFKFVYVWDNYGLTPAQNMRLWHDPYYFLRPPEFWVSSTRTTTTIRLTWVDNAENEEGYRVQRSTDGIFFSTINDAVAADATTYDDENVPIPGTYYYRVIAKNVRLGNSEYAQTSIIV